MKEKTLKCRISLAIPESVEYDGLEWFNGKKIATSYPNILRKFAKEKNLNIDIHTIQGSVEIAPEEIGTIKDISRLNENGFIKPLSLKELIKLESEMKQPKKINKEEEK